MTLIAKNIMIYPRFRLLLVLLLLTTVAQGQSTEDYLSGLENQVIDEMNFARTNPSQYANILREHKQWFDGKYVRMPGEITLVTNEGVSAVNEAIQFMERQRPLSPLIGQRGMSRGAQDHVRDQGPKGGTGHTGSDGSTPWDRIERYGSWQHRTGENISYGADSARRIVMQLIIDDGVPSRGHRDNIFNKKFNVTGVAVGKHKKYGQMCVITYAEG